MTAPLAHTAIGAKPSASTTGRIHRGGRPVATTNWAPAATAARTASRVRGVMVSFSSNNVPSTSQAMSAGNIGFVTETSLRRSAFAVHGSQPAPSVQSALVLPRSGHAIGPVPLRPLLQFRQSDRPGVFLARRAATQPPRHPILAFGMGIFRLHSIEQLIHRVAQRDVELLWGAVGRQRPTGGHGDRNFVA